MKRAVFLSHLMGPLSYQKNLEFTISLCNLPAKDADVVQESVKKTLYIPSSLCFGIRV